MSSKPDDEGQKAKERQEGLEPLEEEASGGSLSPSPELEEALREATEAVEAREAELRALRAQVDPHFLFNSLNSISSLITADPREARQMCVHLGDFLRASLKQGTRPTVTLAEELATLELYLKVEGARFGSRLEVVTEVDEASQDCAVPPLLLQPLVENAIKHGISSLLEGGTVGIVARRRGSRLHLVVENPFDASAPRAEGVGLGLANLGERLKSLYGPDARVSPRADGSMFRVEVVLPVIEQEQRA